MSAHEPQKLLPSDVDFVIYHYPCSDGFAAALMVWVYMKTNYPERDVIYYPAVHGKPPPNVSGRNVLICDFSYLKQDIINMINSANNLLIIDHHITALRELDTIDEKYKIFDMNHSGASLTWKYCNSKEENLDYTDAPLLIQYIEDRDLWKKQLPYTEEFATWFHTLPFEFELYEKYLDDELLLQDIKTKGVSFLECNKIHIDDAVKHVTIKFIKLGTKYYFVGFVNSTIARLRSDIGNAICTQYKLLDFAAVYWMTDQGTPFSLRSTNIQSDVAIIAKYLGGGGHRNAAGIHSISQTSDIVLPSSERLLGNVYNLLEKVRFAQITIGSSIYKIVCLNSSIHQDDLGSYLLQTKYTHKSGKDVSVGMSLYLHSMYTPKQIEEEIDISYVVYIPISVIWHYNGTTNSYHHTFTFDRILKDDIDIICTKLNIIGITMDDNNTYLRGRANYLSPLIHDIIL